MTKPANFPERKRQRQLGALGRLRPSRSNNPELLALLRATETSKRDVKTKKVRA